MNCIHMGIYIHIPNTMYYNVKCISRSSAQKVHLEHVAWLYHSGGIRSLGNVLQNTVCASLAC